MSLSTGNDTASPYEKLRTSLLVDATSWLWIIGKHQSEDKHVQIKLNFLRESTVNCEHKEKIDMSLQQRFGINFVIIIVVAKEKKKWHGKVA